MTTTQAATNSPAPAAAGALVLERIFDAPRELVFKAWSEPERLMRWWGPKGFTSPTCRMDFRAGGQYVFCMRWPDGRDSYTAGVYCEIVPPERLVFTDSFSDADGNLVPASAYGLEGDWPAELLVTVTFEDLGGGRTRLTLRQEGIPAGEMREMTGQGWNESFDKLAESLRAAGAAGPRHKLVVSAEPGSNELTMTREFDAPRALVFKALTDPGLIPQWWGPAYLTTVVEEMDVRPGGRWRYLQRDGDGNEYGFHGEYREVVPPERIVQTFVFEGAPEQQAVDTLTLADLDGGRTLYKVVSIFPSVQARDAMIESGMEGGAAESMDRLEALLAQMA